MRRQSAVPSLVVAALLAGACGGGDGETAAATTTAAPQTSTTPAPSTTLAPTTTIPATTTTAAPAPAADLSGKAKAAVFQQADFPAGYKPHPDGDAGGLNLEGLWKELLGCLGAATTQATGVGTSATYLRGVGTQARSTVEYTSEASASAIATALSGAKAQGCLTTAFQADVKRSAPEGGVPGPVQVASRPTPVAAPKAASFRITATIDLGELKIPIFQDFFVIFAKGAVLRAFFLNPGAEFPQELETSLLEKLLSRA